MRMLALGLLAAAGIALAGPATAQGLYFGAGPGGGGVAVGADHYDHDRYDGDRYRERVVVRERRHECHTIIIHDDGEVRRIRRCR